MSKYLIVILIFISLNSCKKEKEIETIQLKKFESISSDTEELITDYYSSIKIIDNELYCFELSTNTIYVFDPYTLKVKRSFGREGRGPGEFNNVWSISKYDSTSILVAEQLNNRVQQIDKNGEKSKILRFPYASKLQTRGNKYYGSAGQGYSSAKIYQFDIDGERKVVFDAKKYCEENEISYHNLIAFYHVTADGSVIMAISGTKKIIRFYDDKEIEFEQPFSDEYEFEAGAIKDFDNGFLISCYYYNKEIEEPMIKDITNIFVHYSKDGKIIKKYSLPESVGCWHGTYEIWNGFLFCANQNEGILYKVDLDGNG